MMAFWAQMILGFLTSALIAFIISRLAIKSADKQLFGEKVGLIKKILNDASRSYSFQKEDKSFKMSLYVFSGEQTPKDYREFVKLLRDFLSDKDPKHLRIYCIAGPQLMVENMKINDVTKIHPSMQLLTDPEFSRFIDFQMVDSERMPYHCLYGTHANVGYAERPHKEVSEAIAWEFANDPTYGRCFENWFELIKEKYPTKGLKYEDGRLFRDGEEINSSNKDKLFFKVKGYLGHIRYYLTNNLKKEVQTYTEKTGMDMTNWNQYSERIFTENEIKLLTD
jgi:hypothetical protein